MMKFDGGQDFAASAFLAADGKASEEEAMPPPRRRFYIRLSFPAARCLISWRIQKWQSR